MTKDEEIAFNNLMINYEKSVSRYIEAEQELMDIMNKPSWKLFFIKNRILKFLVSRIKYDF